MKPRLNEQVFARVTPADRRLIEKAARLSHARASDIIREGAVNYAHVVIARIEEAKERVAS